MLRTQLNSSAARRTWTGVRSLDLQRLPLTRAQVCYVMCRPVVGNTFFALFRCRHVRASCQHVDGPQSHSAHQLEATGQRCLLSRRAYLSFCFNNLDVRVCRSQSLSTPDGLLRRTSQIVLPKFPWKAKTSGRILSHRDFEELRVEHQQRSVTCSAQLLAMQ